MCLAALAATDARPAEIVLVDQSGEGVAARAAAEYDEPFVRVVEDDGRGAARARNRGAEAARGDLLLFVDDDCVADPGIVGAARRLHREYPRAILTGQMRAGGDRDAVPSVREDPEPRDFSGTFTCAALYTGSMAVPRREFLAFGGFDERFPSAGGEDNDFCYRWLRAGHELRYEPELIVTHRDWRTPEQLRAVRAEYGRAAGMFYAKHLRAGDVRVLTFLIGDLRILARAHLRAGSVSPIDTPAVGMQLRSIVTNWHRFA